MLRQRGIFSLLFRIQCSVFSLFLKSNSYGNGDAKKKRCPYVQIGCGSMSRRYIRICRVVPYCFRVSLNVGFGWVRIIGISVFYRIFKGESVVHSVISGMSTPFWRGVAFCDFLYVVNDALAGLPRFKICSS